MPPLPPRPRLTPAMADIRRAVRESLRDTTGLTLVGLSGGADSLALAAALAFTAKQLGISAGAVIVDHGLQNNSPQVANRAAKQAQALGLDPVRLIRVTVSGPGGPEASARRARYAAYTEMIQETGASFLLLGHTLDDQAETVLLALARGSGAGSLRGMAPSSGRYLRPLLGIRRETTRQACLDQNLDWWEDPHNHQRQYARVRVRERVLPVLEEELGPGVAEALARTAEIAREDSEAFEQQLEELVEDVGELAEGGVAISIPALSANPKAIIYRMIRYVAKNEFGVSLSRSQTLEIAKLLSHWHGQHPLSLPGFTVCREQNRLVFQAAR